MIVEKGHFRMNLSITGRNREECIAQIRQEYCPPQPLVKDGPKTVDFSKLDLCRTLKAFINDENAKRGGYSLLEAKLFVEKNFPQLNND